MAITFQALIEPLYGLDFGTTGSYLSIPALIIVGLMVFAVTRQPQKMAILFLPMALAWNVAGLKVGLIPIAFGAVLFVINSFSLQSIGLAISGTYDGFRDVVKAGGAFAFTQKQRDARAERLHRQGAGARFTNKLFDADQDRQFKEIYPKKPNPRDWIESHQDIHQDQIELSSRISKQDNERN